MQGYNAKFNWKTHKAHLCLIIHKNLSTNLVMISITLNLLSRSDVNLGSVSVSDKTSYHNISQPRDLSSESGRSEIWQASRQHCCRGACQISKRYDNSNYQSRDFEISRDLVIRYLLGYWNELLAPFSLCDVTKQSIGTRKWQIRLYTAYTHQECL